MFDKCENCGHIPLITICYESHKFCSTKCRDHARFPAFCRACIDSSAPESAGDSISFNGIGSTFYGSRDRCPTCHSVVRAQWLCFFFIPVYPLGRYRLKYVSRKRYLSRLIPR